MQPAWKWKAKSMRKQIWVLLFLLLPLLALLPTPTEAEMQKQMTQFESYKPEDTLTKPLLPLTMTQSPTQFIYTSSLGTYAFNKSDAVWSFTERGGTLLSPSTRFITQVNIDGSWEDLPIQSVSVAEATTNLLRYQITHTSGTATITIQHSETSPPKFTIQFNKQTANDTRITWKTTVPQAWKYFSFDMKTSTGIGAETHTHQKQHVVILDKSTIADSKIALMINWMDFGETTVQLKGSTITVIFPANTNLIDPTLYEYYDSGDDWGGYEGWGIYFSYWKAQTFTAQSSHYIDIVSLKIHRAGSIGTVTVSIRATSNGLPTGSDLTSGTIESASISTVADWHNITITACKVIKDEVYAIVVRAPSASFPNVLSWRMDITSPTYANGEFVSSIDSGVFWVETSPSADAMFRLYGQAYAFTFAGCFWEDTGLLKGADERAVNVTAHFSDGNADETFEVNGTYGFTTDNELLYFSYALSTSSSSQVVSQYGLNLLVYNQSAYYDILFPSYEVDTDYTVSVSCSWNTTTDISNEATTGCRVTFGTVPNELSNYLNWYVYRTSTSTTTTTTREYWVSPQEAYSDTLYIFDATLTTYTITFIDHTGILKTYPYVAAKRMVNGSLFTCEKRKVDNQKTMIMNLKQSEKYTLVIEGTTYSWTYGDLITTSTTDIQLIVKGTEFPKETILIYKYMRIYGYRTFADPIGSITISYYDAKNQTTSVAITIKYENESLATSTYTSTSNSFTYTFASADNSTDYQVSATINHELYGTQTWKQYFPATNPSGLTLTLDWLGTLDIDTSILIPTFIILCVAGCFSIINAEVGAFMACITAALLTWLGLISIAPGFLVSAFFFAVAMALVYSKRRVSYS